MTHFWPIRHALWVAPQTVGRLLEKRRRGEVTVPLSLSLSLPKNELLPPKLSLLPFPLFSNGSERSLRVHKRVFYKGTPRRRRRPGEERGKISST